MRRRGADRSRRTFDALQVRNFRLYFWGQIISVSGTWMQSLAQAWLVLKLTGSGSELGLVTAVQFLPMLLAGSWGGLVADRVDKRRMLVFTQLAAGTLALVLGLLTLTGTVRVWMVFALAAGLGSVNAVDNPTRQSFVIEMVGPDRVTNAVTLNSVVMNGARVVGPAIGGVLISTIGIAPCFLVNAGSFVAVVVALMAMNRKELRPTERVAARRGQVKEGWRYVWSTPALRTPILLVAVIGTLAYNFTVTLPLLARYTFHRGAGGLGLMTSVFGFGAVVGGLITASRGDPNGKRLARTALTFGGLILATAAMPMFPLELVSLAVMGAFSITFIVTANTSLQLASAPEMRGRVMALYAVAFLGSTPIGAPLVGWISEVMNPRFGVGLGGAATVIGAVLAWPSLTGGRIDDRVRLLARRGRVRASPVETPAVEA